MEKADFSDWGLLFKWKQPTCHCSRFTEQKSKDTRLHMDLKLKKIPMGVGKNPLIILRTGTILWHESRTTARKNGSSYDQNKLPTLHSSEMAVLLKRTRRLSFFAQLFSIVLCLLGTIWPLLHMAFAHLDVGCSRTGKCWRYMCFISERLYDHENLIYFI